MSTPSLVGTLDRSMDSTLFLTKDDLHWIDYRSLGGIVETVPGIYVRTQNSVGQYDQINIRGSDWRSVGVNSNGRPLNDPASGIYNLYHFTPEYADRIEFVTGPRAFLYGFNSTGGAINVVTKNYNSNRPFTKINYTESAYDYQYSDGTFSQNVSRKLNFTCGFQHQGTIGRFANSADDAWNMRVKFRYQLSRDLNLILSEYLTTTETNMNGGADTTSARTRSAFDQLRAKMRNTDSFEKTNRNDIDLSLVATVFGDTANVSLLTFYYSHNFREYRDAENRPSPNGVLINSDHTSSWMGAVFTQNLNTQSQHLTAGASLEVRQIEGSPNLGRRRNVLANAWAKDDLLLSENLTLSGFGRYDRYVRKNYVGFGADATFRLSRGVALFGGMSVSRRQPNYQELYWTDSTASRVDPITAEKHRQAEIGVRLTIEDVGKIHFAYFHRTTENAIQLSPYRSGFVFPSVLYANVDGIHSNGLETTVALRLWHLYLEGTGTYLVQKSSGGSRIEYYPEIVAQGGVYFWDNIPGTSLNLKAGFKGRYTSSQLGAEFNPEMLAYIDNPGMKIGQGGFVDFFLIGHIGDAYVHFMWENLTNVQYFSTPFYPVLDRAIRFGVSWEFLN